VHGHEAEHRRWAKGRDRLRAGNDQDNVLTPRAGSEHEGAL